MRDIHSGFRLLALTLVAVLTLTLAAPAPAEALEPLTIVAIAGLAVVAVIIIVYLVVANAAPSRGNVESEPRYMACVESDTEARACWAVPEQIPGVSALAPTTTIPQGG
jgi:hypothetical protein